MTGIWFHSCTPDGLVEWQGHILSRCGSKCRCQLYEWIVGEPSKIVTVDLADMRHWVFYATAAEMNAAYEAIVERAGRGPNELRPELHEVSPPVNPARTHQMKFHDPEFLKALTKHINWMPARGDCDRDIHVTPYSGHYGLAGHVVAVEGSPVRLLLVVDLYYRTIVVFHGERASARRQYAHQRFNDLVFNWLRARGLQMEAGRPIEPEATPE